MASNIVRAELAHETPRRLRLRAESLIGDSEACGVLAGSLRAISVFSYVDVRVSTGSIVLAHETDRGAALCAIAPLIEITAPAIRPEKTPTRPIEAALNATQSIDGALKMSSGGRLGLADAGFVALCVMTAVQIGRGYVTTPALGLLWSAVSLAARFGQSATPK